MQLAEDQLSSVRGGAASHLRDDFARISAEQERLRQDREQYKQQFQALDQKQNLTLQALTSLVKTLAQIRNSFGKSL